MKVFEVDGKMYAKVIPVKRLFNSTTVHEVVNRGDVFVVRLEDMALTVLAGYLVPAEEDAFLNVALMPTPFKHKVMETVPKKPKVDTVTVAKMKKDIKKVLSDAQQILNGM